jgi:hypothetical protein
VSSELLNYWNKVSVVSQHFPSCNLMVLDGLLGMGSSSITNRASMIGSKEIVGEGNSNVSLEVGEEVDVGRGFEVFWTSILSRA